MVLVEYAMDDRENTGDVDTIRDFVFDIWFFLKTLVSK